MANLKSMNNDGNTYINKNMIVSIVSLATKEIDGVVNMYKSKRLSLRGLFDKNIGNGVSVKYTNLGILIDIYVIVSSDCEVNDIVYRIQQNVKNSLASLLSVNIKAINVHIMDAEKVSL